MYCVGELGPKTFKEKSSLLHSNSTVNIHICILKNSSNCYIWKISSLKSRKAWQFSSYYNYRLVIVTLQVEKWVYVPDFRFKKSLNSQITCAILVNYIFLWQSQISEPYCYCFFCGMFEWRVHSHSAPCWNSNKVRKLPIRHACKFKTFKFVSSSKCVFFNFLCECR